MPVSIRLRFVDLVLFVQESPIRARDSYFVAATNHHLQDTICIFLGPSLLPYALTGVGE